MRYDVLVVGAGPAGSTAARECAARGLSVMILDRAEFPRDKPCGGGVNVRAAQLISFDLEEVVERVVTGMRVSIKQGESYVRHAAGPLTYMTQRRRLDALLLHHAVDAGAVLRERAPVREVERYTTHVAVRSGRERFEGRSLVVADGANGRTAALAGITVRRSMWIAYEGNVDVKGRYPEAWTNTFGVDVGSYPGGYGWLFPKGDHVNIGIGGEWSMGPSLRKRLELLTRYYGFCPEDMRGVRGHPLPVRRPGSPVHDGNVLLVGDAAGLVDVLSGEGIFSAVWSGRAAARHIERYLSAAVPDLSSYRAELEGELGRDLAVSSQLHDIFHLSPSLAALLVRRSFRMWRLVCGLITGNTTYASIKERSRLLAAGIDVGSAAARMLDSWTASQSGSDRAVTPAGGQL